MTKHILPLLAVTALAGLSSCSSDDFEQNTSGDIANKVVLTSEPYTFEDGTRTTLTNSGSAISFAWDDDETIGIFPIAPTTNYQAKQKLNGGTGDGTTSTFDGAGWALKKGNTYAAYYPYVKNLDEDKGYTAVPVDMTGQTQDGNNSLVHIGAGYDYMYAESTVPSSGTMQFDFKHVASIIMLELTMPEAATWTNVTLSGTGSVFITQGTMNVSTGAVTSTATSSSISLDLENITTTSANEKLTLYMAVLPCTTGALTLTATTSDDKTYTATLATKTLQAGHAYKWTATLEAYTPPVYLGVIYASEIRYFKATGGNKKLTEYLTKDIVSNTSYVNFQDTYIATSGASRSVYLKTLFKTLDGKDIVSGYQNSMDTYSISSFNTAESSPFTGNYMGTYGILLVPADITLSPMNYINSDYEKFTEMNIVESTNSNDGRISYLGQNNVDNSIVLNGINYKIYTSYMSTQDSSIFEIKFE